MLSVSDSGVEMSVRNLERLFDLTARLTTPRTDGEKGIGFGLVLCAEFARRIGGSLTAESAEARGSAFRLPLPGSIT